jgi:hypothetical protein
MIQMAKIKALVTQNDAKNGERKNKVSRIL